MIIGAHVSAAGGIANAIDRAVEIGAEGVQIFGSSTRSWRFKALTGAQAEDFRMKSADAGMAPPFLHAIYLINLGNPNPDNVEKSVTSLVNYMRLGRPDWRRRRHLPPGEPRRSRLRRHLPAGGGQHQPGAGTDPRGAAAVPGEHGRHGQHIGAKFSELGDVLRAVDSPRLGICLDTQHAFAAGYDLTNPDGVAGMIDEFDRDIGLDRLAAVHANDSKRPCGSGVDRHDNIGEGPYRGTGF